MDARRLIPVVAPLTLAAGLALIVAVTDDGDAPEARPVAYPSHASDPPRARPVPSPPEAPAAAVDRSRCLAKMTVEELGRQLVQLRQAEALAELYREQAPPEVARGYLQGLADTSTALSPGVARSRLLAIAADGLVRLGHPEAARVTLVASRDLPPPEPSDFGFERSDFRGQAAGVAARLGDHALAQTLVEDDPEAQAALARCYAELGDVERARALLAATVDASGLGERVERAAALAAAGELEEALSLADRSTLDSVLLRLEIARTLLRQERAEQAAAVLRDAVAAMPEAPPDSDPKPEPGPESRPSRRIGPMVAMARALHEAGQPQDATQLRERARTELRALGDHFEALGLWPALAEATHRAGERELAWQDLAALEAVSLSSMGAGAMTRVLLLTREGRLAEALTVIHDTAGMPYPLAYAHVHAALHEPDPEVERELDRGLRSFCP
ncbi:hypothetical protein [Paraliomyxa miuraensis]|uniref:hypothetical protein n=1 Tax=Paraliomyxa miuraensis TaxID=376150 RepID=UPI0022577995|nr:hypothetical protein [Paraliomyxa miuraensis]MCX4247850.1 hypothetical protein [Paraliomyxa miuraensis]